MNIALANELALIADKLGLNVWDAIRLANLGYKKACLADKGLAAGINVQEGRVTNKAVAETFGVAGAKRAHRLEAVAADLRTTREKLLRELEGLDLLAAAKGNATRGQVTARRKDLNALLSSAEKTGSLRPS